MATITKESIKIEGEKVLNKVKELVKEGNVRKISIHEKDGRELMSFPLSLGVVGAVFAPVLAAVGALAALIGECSITVEREEKSRTGFRFMYGSSCYGLFVFNLTVPALK